MLLAILTIQKIGTDIIPRTGQKVSWIGGRGSTDVKVAAAAVCGAQHAPEPSVPAFHPGEGQESSGKWTGLVLG